mmetsp:Transcript_54184/g.108815  ORF Transcript_54184/g.108815 Transcript_54184/m.108815 type:complete len:203 (-) Transcript_54184:205-813(-)
MRCKRGARRPPWVTYLVALLTALLCHQTFSRAAEGLNVLRAFLPAAGDRSRTATLPPRAAREAGIHLLGASGALLGPALARADEAEDAKFKEAAEKAGVPTFGISTPPSKSMAADLWTSWGTTREAVTPDPSEIDSSGSGFPIILALVGGAALLGLVLPMLPPGTDLEAARKKGKPEWLVEEEAEQAAERARLRAEAGLPQK